MNKNLKLLTRLAVLSAIIIILAFTPIGYIRIMPGLAVTIITIPVAIGAAIMGPIAGLILGIVFGVTSFIQAFTDPIFGQPMVAYNVFLAAAVCIVPRALMGFITGLISKGIPRLKKLKPLAYGASGLICSILNTALFLTPIYLVFKFVITSDIAAPVHVFATSTGLPMGAAILSIGFANGIPEAIVTALVCVAVCNILRKVLKDN